jgi:hypothetical protein
LNSLNRAAGPTIALLRCSSVFVFPGGHFQERLRKRDFRSSEPTGSGVRILGRIHPIAPRLLLRRVFPRPVKQVHTLACFLRADEEHT